MSTAKKILQSKEAVLRKVAKEVLIKDIKTPKIQKMLKEMSASLRSQDDGVAIAAPQIGYSLRIFVVSGKIFEAEFSGRDLSKENQPDGSKMSVAADPESGAKRDSAKKVKDLVFINPKIIKLSREKAWVPEGCLSVRPFYGKTYRSTKALVSAYDDTGKKFQLGAAGLLAQIFQHETDHLNGILFIDHAKDLKEEQPK